MARARDVGLDIGTLPSGPLDAITDVAGIHVGSVTLIEGDAVRTGVTVVVPWDGREALFAGTHRLNGNGEVTGLEWIRDWGCLSTPIGLTNTHSVGVVRDALVAADVREREPVYWSLPVVGETWDGVLNDINGFHVRPEHVHEALARALPGAPVEEGGAGSGTGMICHGFKGGLGSASRVVADGWTVGVLVQANHGRRDRLVVNGLPVGRLLGPGVVPLPWDEAEGAGSIIVLCATDAPLLPHQCRRLAQRCALGVARTGGAGEHASGDFMLAFSTHRQGVPASEEAQPDDPLTQQVTMVVDTRLDPLFYAAIEATEAAIVNALLGAETMTGCGTTAHAIGAQRLLGAVAALGPGPTAAG